MLLVAVENLVASLARYAELATQMAHLLAFQQASHKSKALLHHRTLFPRHRQFPPAIAGGNCYPCVRYELSPMSRVVQVFHDAIRRCDPDAREDRDEAGEQV